MITYSLATEANANAKVYKPVFVHNYHHHARQHSISGQAAKPALAPSGLMLGAGEGGGILDFSLQVRMVIQIDAGISKYVFWDVRVQALQIDFDDRSESDDH